MNTIAYLFLFAAGIMLRAVSKGRSENIVEDVSDAFLALVQGDGKAFREVANRTGDSLTAPEAHVATGGSSGLSGLPTNGAIGRAAVKRGSLARGYEWGKTGPDYYDCSGLMWRACQDAGVYPRGDGNRFNTASIKNSKFFTKVEGTPAIDDIVLWAPGVGGVTGHMGVVTGTDTFYSARSKKTGIGYAKIKEFRKASPVYYRAKTGAAGDTAGGGGGGSW
jgi:CHAP domain